MNKTTNIIVWTASLTAALIMLQTLYFKFSAQPESVYIFTTVGMEPFGRIGIGIGELIASGLLLTPALRWIGALMGAGLMIGALFFHLTILGIEVMNDGGKLFLMALIVFISCIVVLYLQRGNLFTFIKKLRPS
jgi:hypothetical protein